MKQISNVLLYSDGKVLLGKRSLNRRTYAGCWAMFGGHAEAGETPFNAATREIREELGIHVSDLKLIHSFDTPKSVEITRFSIFLSMNWVGEPRLLGDEHSEMCWLDIQQAMKLENLALNDYQTTFRMVSQMGLLS